MVDQDEMFDVDLLPSYPNKLRGFRRINGQPEELEHPITVPKIYDQFVTNNIEYLVLPFINYNELTVRILKENNFIILESNVLTGKEPVFMAFRSTKLNDTYENTHDIVMCVYFLQNSNEEIIRFVNYYTSQGIEKIFMYYCGDLSKRTDLPVFDNVAYFEWNYVNRVLKPEQYHDTEKQGLQSFVKNNGIHFSQVPLYNSFSKKIGKKSNWTFLVDLDEFVIAPNKSLKEYLKDDALTTHLFTDHRRAHIDFKNGTAFFESSCIHKGGGKTILKKSKILDKSIMNVHRADRPTESDLIMLHHKIGFKYNENCNIISF
jgi:hypothetical protein